MIILPKNIDLDLSKATAIIETEKYTSYEFDNLILKVYDKSDASEDTKDQNNES